MEWLGWVILGLTLAIGLPVLVLSRAHSPNGTFWSNVAYGLSGLYCRTFHGSRVTGRQHIPDSRHPGPTIVVANHTAGIDPVLVAVECPFHIRWVMAEDMRLPWLGWFWRWQRVIFVNREGKDRRALRESLRELDAGGVIGIFPEGGLERPKNELLRFEKGVGMLIKRSGARVLPVWIADTPQVDPAWASLWHPSRSRIAFAPVIEYAETGMSGDEIVEDLHARFVTWTGWPINESPPTPDVDPKKSARTASA